MPTILNISLFLALLISPFWTLAAQVAPPPSLAVKDYILQDFNSSTVIASYKKDERVEPASLTKIMTAYVTFDAIQQGHLKLDQTLPVSETAWKIEDRKSVV